MTLEVDFNIMREPGFFTKMYRNREKNHKKIDSNGGWKNVTFCPICKTSTEKNKNIKYSFLNINSLICTTCQCLYNDKIPKIPNIHFITIKPSQIKFSAYEQKYDYRKKRFGKERIKILQQYFDKPLEEARLLDVGCNTGFFLDVAKPYCKQVEGIETSKPIAEYTSKKLRTKVHTTDLFNFKPRHKFDIITMFNLIEHISNPFEFLVTAKNLLNKGGVIFIFTPNYISLSFEIFGIKSNLYCPTDHLLFFSKQTVKYVAEKLNMDLQMYDTRGMDIFDIMAFERDVNKIDITKSSILQNINIFQNYLDEVGIANSMRFILKKK